MAAPSKRRGFQNVAVALAAGARMSLPVSVANVRPHVAGLDVRLLSEATRLTQRLARASHAPARPGTPSTPRYAPAQTLKPRINLFAE